MTSLNKRARAWCWTLNNYTAEETIKLANVPCKYIVWGCEVGESGTPHLQGYIELANASTGKCVAQLLGGRAHVEPRLCKLSQHAANYCLKGAQSHAEWDELGADGPNFGKDYSGYTRGTISAQGKRTDLADIGSRILAGSSPEDIAHECPGTFIQYSRGIERLASLRFKDRTERPKCVWRWGLAGAGKSYKPMHSHSSYYIKGGTKWWDGYEQQEAIIIDDFSKDLWDFRDLLRLLDEYPYSGEIKGGFIKINSPYIYVTCEHSPATLWTGNELAQIERRFAEIIEVRVSSDALAPKTVYKTEYRDESLAPCA